MSFERVTYSDAHKRRTVILRDVVENEHVLVGYEVRNHAEGWSDVAPTGFDERLRVIGRSLIVKRCELIEDRTYGKLVERDASES